MRDNGAVAEVQRKIERRDHDGGSAREPANAGWMWAVSDFLRRKVCARVFDGEVNLADDRAHFANRLGDRLAGFDGDAAGKFVLCLQKLGLRAAQTFDSLGKLSLIHISEPTRLLSI